MLSVIYTPLAQRDLAEAVDYLYRALGAPQAAESLLDELDEVVDQIRRFPYSCELYRTDLPMGDEIRQTSVKKYVLYYAAFEDRIEVRRFLHGRRNRDGII